MKDFDEFELYLNNHAEQLESAAANALRNAIGDKQTLSTQEVATAVFEASRDLSIMHLRLYHQWLYRNGMLS